ncbi:MAG: TIGR00730 family Rossman fold protein, partial [Candidatus Eisenbacteria bacterium]
ELAARGIGLAYGGGRAGVMGELADAALAAGGRVTGVIPGFMYEKGLAHPGVRDLRVVSSMHERKALLSEISDAFLALPGAFGTLDELFEALTGAQLGLHRKPCALLNSGGYYDLLVAFLDRARARGLLSREHRALLVVGRSPGSLLDRLDRPIGRTRRSEAPAAWRPARTDREGETLYARIYGIVRRVPRGRVASYGQIAALAGIPNPRQVGYALHALPAGNDVPWHRVINAKGQVSARSEPGCAAAQRRLLEGEGILFNDRGKVPLARFGWRPKRANANRRDG